MAQLTALAAGADGLESRPQGLFVVGAGVDVGMIKPELDAATSLAVSVPGEPETALAPGAELASAHAPYSNRPPPPWRMRRIPAPAVDPDRGPGCGCRRVR